MHTFSISPGNAATGSVISSPIVDDKDKALFNFPATDRPTIKHT